MKTRMGKYEESKNNEKYWTWVDTITQGKVAYKMNLQESIKESRGKGLPEGLQEEKVEGIAQTLLFS